MSGRRLIVLESNEVPPRIFQWYAEQFPAGAIARLLWEGALHRTVNHDLPDLGGRELYPSQTWATLATGVPFREHGVYWYGDPKPAAYPLYWQLAARAGKRVGIVGTLHSSPLAQQADDPNIAFAIPDCFATDDATTPARYRSFQRLNLAMTRGSGRVVAAKPGVRDLATLATSWRIGVRPRSLTTLAQLSLEVAARRVPRERLRVAQFVMLADIFQSLTWQHDPDLAVLFTNHVASMMHRYWYALFPGDWPDRLYDDAWVRRYGREITHAMYLLDCVIAELRTFCEQTDRSLVIVSSMGQTADVGRRRVSDRFAVVRDPERFVRLVSDDHVAVMSGMVPQVSAVYASADAATDARARVEDAELEGLRLVVDQAREVLTFTYEIDAARDTVVVDGRPHTFTDAGVAVHDVDEHRTAEHDPVGTMLVHDLPLTAVADERIDVLRVAPTILDAIGVEPPRYHQRSLVADSAATVRP